MVKYSDIVIPDNSITDLATQLRNATTAYNQFSEIVKKDAGALSQSMQQLTTATSGERSQLLQLVAEVEKLRARQDALDSTYKKTVQTLTAKEKAEKRLAQAQSQEGREVALLNEQTRQQNTLNRQAARESLSTANSIQTLRNRVAQLKVEWANTDRESREYITTSRELIRATRDLANEEEKRARVFTRGVGNYSGGITKVLGRLGALVGGFQLVFRAARDGFNSIVSFEQANANLATIVGTTRDQITTLTNSALRLGATTEYTASQVTVLQTELAKLGFNQTQITQMQAPILQFATALQADLGEAAELAGAALRSFGYDASQTERVVAAMTVGANRSALSFSYLNSSFSDIAPVARGFGFEVEDVVALLGALSNAGFDASTAATSTRNILLNLADSSGELAQQLGRPVKNLDDLVEGLITLRSRGIDLSTTLQLTDKRSVTAFNTFLRGAEDLRELRKELENTEGELERIQREQLNTTEGSVKLLNSAWEGLMLSFSNTTTSVRYLIDGLTSAVTWINNTIFATQRLREAIKEQWDESWSEEEEAINKLVETYIKAGDDIETAQTKGLRDYRANANERIATLTAEADSAQEEYLRLNGLYTRYNNWWADDKVTKKMVNEAKKRAEGIRRELGNLNYNVNELAGTEIMDRNRNMTGDFTGSYSYTGSATNTTTNESTETITLLSSAQISKLKKQRDERLKLERAAIDAEINALEEGFAKQNRLREEQQRRVIEDLEVERDFKKKYEKLSSDDFLAYNKIIAQIRDNQAKETIKAQAKQNSELLASQRSALELELTQLEGTSTAYIKKRIEILEVQKQQEIASNNALTEEMRQSEAAINAKWDKTILEESNKWAEGQRASNLEFYESELNLLTNNEKKKQALLLMYEAETLRLRLQMMRDNAELYTVEEIKTLENRIALMDRDASKLRKQSGTDSIWHLLGIDIEGDEEKAIASAFDFAIDQVNKWADARVEAAERVADAASKDTEEALRNYEIEVQLAQSGYANRVNLAKKEYDEAREREQQALAQQEEMRQQQERLNTLQQVSSLITGAANIFGTLPIWAAIPAVALMFGSFLAARQQAQQSVQTFGDGGQGVIGAGTHASGNDTFVGTTADGRQRRAERNERWAIFSSKVTRQGGRALEKHLADIQRYGYVEQIIDNKNHASDVNVIIPKVENKQLSRDVAAIRKQGEREITRDGKYQVSRYKNVITKTRIS